MNAWMQHLKKVMAENKGKSLRECMMIAKKSYKKPNNTMKTKTRKSSKRTKMKKSQVKKSRKGGKSRKNRKSRGRK